MNIKLVLASAVAAGTLLLAGNASAQWSGSIVVSGGVEPGPGGPDAQGVSAARCGNNVVVGFGDQDSSTPNSNSFAGFSVSTDGGNTFKDLGTLPVAPAGPNSFGPNELGFGPGNPGVACSSASQFYYASVYLSRDHICFFPDCPSISVSSSADGGKTWGLPVVVATGPGDTHDLGSPSIAVDPTSPRIYVAYIDDNIAGPSDFVFPDCDNTGDVAELRLGRSTDGGKTWTTNIVDHFCSISSNPEHQGTFGPPNVLVSPGGKVYLTYEFHPTGNPTPLPNEIRFTRSVDQGATFGATIVVSNTAIDKALPQIAVDRTGLRSRGEVYVTWSGARSATSTDVLVSDSVNQGVSFSFPRPISPTPVTGPGHFQTNPVVAVDNDGQVAACYYETPGNSPTSSSVYSYKCALSFNNTASWQLQTVINSVPVGLDALTSDFLLANDGFFTAFEQKTSSRTWLVGRKADR